MNIWTWKVLYELMNWKNGHETNLLSFTNCCARNNQCGIWNAPFNKRTIKRFFTLNVIVFINRIRWCFREIEEKRSTFNIKRKKKNTKAYIFMPLLFSLFFLISLISRNYLFQLKTVERGGHSDTQRFICFIQFTNVGP